MSLQNFVNKMQIHSQDMETKLSVWKSTKKKGSKGEQITRDFLRKHNLSYKEQVSFKNLYYKSKEFPLRFDFQVWYKESWFLLEIDGGQHNKKVNWSGNLTEQEMESALQENLERDSLKNEYCRSHNIRLERVAWNGNKKKLIEDLTSVFRNY